MESVTAPLIRCKIILQFYLLNYSLVNETQIFHNLSASLLIQNQMETQLAFSLHIEYFSAPIGIG